MFERVLDQLSTCHAVNKRISVVRGSRCSLQEAKSKHKDIYNPLMFQKEQLTSQLLCRVTLRKVE